jgi:membrane protein
MLSLAASPETLVSDSLRRVGRRARTIDGQVRRGGGWPRILRNATYGYFSQAGGRMAAALSYYSIFVGGPVLVLTLTLGSLVFGEEATRASVALAVERVLPPDSTGASEVATRIVHASTPAAGLALLAGLLSLVGFTRALAASLNVTLKAEGTEPFHRTFLVGPVLVVAIVGLLWGAWASEILLNVVQFSTGVGSHWLAELALDGLAPLVLAWLYFAIILWVVPRVQLSRREVVVPAACGAALWELARHVFGWVTAGEGAYTRVFGPLGGVVALLAWVYVSCAVLVLTGQLAWAYAMERRGRGHLAYVAPKQAGLEGWMRPFNGDNAVNEDYPA